MKSLHLCILFFLISLAPSSNLFSNDSPVTIPEAAYIDWNSFHEDTRGLAKILENEGPFHGVIAITRGGLFPAGLLAYEMDLRVIETIGLQSYRDDKSVSQIEEIKQVLTPFGDGEGILIVDDLVDSGNTAAYVKKLYPKAKVAVVYAKPRGMWAADYFFKEFSDETWVYFPWDY